MMRIKDALLSLLIDRQIPVVTEYDLFLHLREIFLAGAYNGRRIHRLPKTLGRIQYARIINLLLDEHSIRPDEDFYIGGKSNQSALLGHIRIFRVSDVSAIPADEVTARIDPFCYISHLSAMQRYSLTNRQPEALHVTTPSEWHVYRDEKIGNDYGHTSEHGEYRPKLLQHKWPERIRKRVVKLHETKRTPLIQTINGSAARIADIGEIFVQMLDQPNLCGGMAHVLDVWANHAAIFSDEIIAAVERAPEKIVKVRAGYILNEVLNVRDDRIEAWTQFAQRGGSRLLDPAGVYVNRYSEKWMISLNVQN